MASKLYDVNKAEQIYRNTNAQSSYETSLHTQAPTSQDSKLYGSTSINLNPSASYSAHQIIAAGPKQQNQPETQTFHLLHNPERIDIVHNIIGKSIPQVPSAFTESDRLHNYYQQPAYYNSNRFQGLIKDQEERRYDYITSTIHDVDHLPVVHEVHHINRPVQKLRIDEIAKPWQVRLLVLERQKAELERLLKMNGKTETRRYLVEDSRNILSLDHEINEQEKSISQKNQEIEFLKDQIQQLEIEFQNAGSEQLSFLTSELDTWKKKFSSLNKQFHECQEDLMMKQAEMESIKNRKVVTQLVSHNTERRPTYAGVYSFYNLFLKRENSLIQQGVANSKQEIKVIIMYQRYIIFSNNNINQAMTRIERSCLIKLQ